MLKAISRCAPVLARLSLFAVFGGCTQNVYLGEREPDPGDAAEPSLAVPADAMSPSQATTTAAPAPARSPSPGDMSAAAPTVATASETNSAQAPAPMSPHAPDWTSFGRDLAQSRSNPDEHVWLAESLELAPTSTREQSPTTGTPAIVDGVVYIADWQGSARAERPDGEVIWETIIDGGVTSSPFVSERYVYFAARNGTLLALERATGVRVWRVTPGFATSRFRSSPVVVDGVLVIGLSDVGSPAQPSAAASALGVDAETGETRWKVDIDRWPLAPTAGPVRVVWSTAAADRELGLAFLAVGRGSVDTPVGMDVAIAVDIQTGELRWRIPLVASDPVLPPTAYAGLAGEYDYHPDSGLVIYHNGDSAFEWRTLIGVASRTGSYSAFDASDGALLWRREAPEGYTRDIMASPAALSDGRLIVPITSFARSRQLLQALDPNTGDLLWEREFAGSRILGGVSIATGLIFAGHASVGPPEDALGERCSLLTLDPEDGSEVFRVPLSAGGCGGGVAIGHGYVAVGSGPTRNQGELDTSSGSFTVLWL